MAHGFTITCTKCGSEDCRMVTHTTYDEIEITIICEECGQVDGY
jgi:uncharacterized Zn finger protein